MISRVKPTGTLLLLLLGKDFYIGLISMVCIILILANCWYHYLQFLKYVLPLAQAAGHGADYRNVCSATL